MSTSTSIISDIGTSVYHNNCLLKKKSFRYLH